MQWFSSGSSILSAFLASFVEFVEALTIILAVGTTRGWRSAWTGATAALFALVLLILVFGRSIELLPLRWMQLGIGTLVVCFGLKWLKKATLRSAGRIPLHDEDRTYANEVAKLQSSGPSPKKKMDHVAFLTSFKAVLLEGLEVVFIIVTVGARSGHLGLAAFGAMIAGAFVLGLGFFIHRPLSKVPENLMKKTVGSLLSAFGIFWVGEGCGWSWPLGDASILLLAVALFLSSVTLSSVLAKHPSRRAA